MGFRNVRKTNVVNESATLVDQEGYAVGTDGVKTAATGDFVYGIVSGGRAANKASEVIYQGEVDAYCSTAVGGAISAEDPLTGGANGMLIKATIGTHETHITAKEAVTAASTKATVFIH